eukprot:2565213-Prymnesium_polylepis.1
MPPTGWYQKQKKLELEHPNVKDALRGIRARPGNSERSMQELSALSCRGRPWLCPARHGAPEQPVRC